MRKLIGLLFAAALLAAPAFARWDAPARQIELRTNTITTIGQTSDTNVPPYAPTNSIQAFFEWMDDNWAPFATNLSYYYLDGTTQNFWRAIVRDYLTVNGSATIATNLWVGGDLVVSNDASILGDLTVTGDISGDVISGTVGIFGSATNGDLTITGTFLNNSNDMALSYLGYPKVTLTTNMITTTTDTTPALLISDLVAVLDGSYATSTTNAVISGVDGEHFYEFDLGANYNGYLVWKSRIDGGGSGWIGAYDQSAIDGLGTTDGDDVAHGQLVGKFTSACTNTFIRAHTGRYFWVGFVTSTVGAHNYAIFEISLFATTNEFRNAGGF